MGTISYYSRHAGTRHRSTPMVGMSDAELQRRCREVLEAAGIVIDDEEESRIEIADFGLGAFAVEGLGLLTYVNTDRYCAKELVLLPGQTCPQHRHPAIDGHAGKEETFRCRAGSVRLFLPGEPTPRRETRLPEGSEQWYSVWGEVSLQPGQQHTIPPDTWHWFQAGPEGAVVSEFSSPSYDELDVFFDPRVVRTLKQAERS
jgi:D-lyxose ketol-isomerase